MDFLLDQKNFRSKLSGEVSLAFGLLLLLPASAGGWSVVGLESTPKPRQSKRIGQSTNLSKQKQKARVFTN
jgi:hypothetical protein